MSAFYGQVKYPTEVGEHLTHMRTIFERPPNSILLARRLGPLGALLTLIFCTQAFAVNYEDPNLSERKDKIATASFVCIGFLRLNDAFKTCLISNGVTDSTEQKDALDMATSMPSSNAGNNTLQNDSGNSFAESPRTPASATKANR